MSGVRARAVPRRRWGIAVLLGASVLINYFDRLSTSPSPRRSSAPSCTWTR